MKNNKITEMTSRLPLAKFIIFALFILALPLAEKYKKKLDEIRSSK